MSFPTIIDRTITAGATGVPSGNDITIACPMPSSIIVGDMLIAFCGGIDNNDDVDNITADDGTWTLLFNTSTVTERFVAYYKIATSSSESLNFNYADADATGNVHDLVTGCIQVRGASNIESDQSIGNPTDPPLFAPSGGTQDYLWIAGSLCHTHHYDGGTTGGPIAPTAPTNYSNVTFVLGDDADGQFDERGPILVYCDRSLRASSEDPGVFPDENDHSGNAIGTTIAIWTPPGSGTNEEKAFFGAPLF